MDNLRTGPGKRKDPRGYQPVRDDDVRPTKQFTATDGQQTRVPRPCPDQPDLTGGARRLVPSRRTRGPGSPAPAAVVSLVLIVCPALVHPRDATAGTVHAACNR